MDFHIPKICANFIKHQPLKFLKSGVYDIMQYFSFFPRMVSYVFQVYFPGKYSENGSRSWTDLFTFYLLNKQQMDLLFFLPYPFRRSQLELQGLLVHQHFETPRTKYCEKSSDLKDHSSRPSLVLTQALQLERT